MLRTNRSQTNRTLVLLLMALIALVSGAVFLAGAKILDALRMEREREDSQRLSTTSA